MKILFLDIDGVLNGHEKLESGYCTIKPECMGWLNFIIRHTGCKLVLTSAWRYMILGGDMTLKGFEYMMITHGLIKQEENLFVGHTVADEDNPSRESQILRYSFNNESIVRYHIWAVVDDLSLNFMWPSNKRFVQTNGKVGLTADDALHLINILNGVV